MGFTGFVGFTGCRVFIGLIGFIGFTGFRGFIGLIGLTGLRVLAPCVSLLDRALGCLYETEPLNPQLPKPELNPYILKEAGWSLVGNEGMPKPETSTS